MQSREHEKKKDEKENTQTNLFSFSSFFFSCSRDSYFRLQNLPNHFAAADGDWPAFGVPDFRVRMMAEAVEECRGQILGLDFAVLGMSADAVRCAMHNTPPDAAAG